MLTHKAITKNAQRLGAIQRSSKTKPATTTSIDLEIEEILRQLMALAFLPGKDIPNALITILERIKNFEVFQKMKIFSNYYIKQWIKMRKPEEWSQFTNIRRTNNATELWNRDLNCAFAKRSFIWTFTSIVIICNDILFKVISRTVHFV
ncbi:hypothetical protein KQX54_010015 [Cotesia glomerata]|uniref:Uncharacterized protein n=1 Tax=Cotesia glomerata TaxID=32391 RepID=A0AAV7IJ08_COTGL|nr:hypothetical protein KQX54_010015 [Cotesia glomerata]